MGKLFVNELDRPTEGKKTALLVSDIVDSTAMGSALGDPTAFQIVRRHDELVRALLVETGGAELQRTDGYLLSFDHVSLAVIFATKYQIKLRTLAIPLQVRIGIHCGSLYQRDAGDVGGLAIAVTSRIASIAQGGQILISEATAKEIDPGTTKFASQGHWAFKGITDPIEVFEILLSESKVASLPDTSKARRVTRQGDLWLPANQIPNSLLAERNRFVGRASFLRELIYKIRSPSRLISVFGTAGIGKTRFVQRAGWMSLGDFSGGVWFCDLSSATTIDGLCAAVAQGLGVVLSTTDPVQELAREMASRGPSLVLLDNFEQVVLHARQTLGTWLDLAVDATFLVTTRTLLGLDGEDVFELAPMSSEDAILLFEERTRGLTRESQPADARDLGRLVDLLDGLPLAIELAAARARLMPVRSIVERMNERFRLLSVADSGRPSRQATMRAALDWSWDLLSAAERDALNQLAVFDGGFRVEAAEAVVDLSKRGDEIEILDILQALIDKSWAVPKGAGRFAFLKGIHAYVVERSDRTTSDEEILSLRARHWRYFAALSDREAAADRCVEVDNLVAATRRATEAASTRDAVAALTKSWALLKLCGPYSTAVDLARRVASLENLDERERANIAFVAGSALRQLGSLAEAGREFDTGLRLARAVNALREQTLLLCALGEHQLSIDRTRAKADADSALRIAIELQDPHLQALALNAIGRVATAEGKHEEALGHYENALRQARTSNDLHFEGGLLGNLGVALNNLGRLDEASDHYRRSLQLAETTGERRWEANIRCNLGLLLHQQGRSVEGRSQLELALSSARILGRPALELIVLWNLGIIAEAAGGHESARAFFVRACEIAKRLQDNESVAELEKHLQRTPMTPAQS